MLDHRDAERNWHTCHLERVIEDIRDVYEHGARAICKAEWNYLLFEGPSEENVRHPQASSSQLV